MSDASPIITAFSLAQENKSELIGFKPPSEGESSFLYIALCKRSNPSVQKFPYCTWLLNMSGPPYFAVGHYDMTLDEALKDFKERR